MTGSDLFTWREEADADAAAAEAAAKAARIEAGHRARFAPRGTKVEREAAFQAATLEALRAELAHLRAKNGGGHG